MGGSNSPYFIMAVIYLPDWDFSCEQFALTDNNTSWLVWLRTDAAARHFFKKNNIVCILGLAINFQSPRWSQAFAVICQGINSTKTEQDRKDATWLMWNDPNITQTKQDGNSWVYISLAEYPEMQFYVNKGWGGITGTFINRVIREPLITVDFDGNDWTEDILRDVLRRINFAPGRPTPGVDPFTPGGHSIHGGGGRSFDDSSDPVSLPVPSGDPVLNSGFLTMYQVNTNKLNDLASFMWNTSLFDVETWQKIMANPFDAIISLNCIPANPTVLSDRAIKIGNVVTSVSAPVVADQFVRIQCGTLDVEEYSGSYLDYSPYTKIEIYLPYIGFRELNTDEIMDKTLTLVYNIDVVSGACVANIMVDNTVLYQFAGDCAMQIPVTGRDPAKTLSSVLGVVTSAGTLAGGAILGTLNPQSAVKAVTATAESVIGGKRNIQRSGNISGYAGFMGGQTPYLIITRPRQALPEEQNLYMGYPSFITSLLGDLSGMTIVADCHLENIPCTDGELQEIERLLKEGVLL